MSNRRRSERFSIALPVFLKDAQGGEKTTTVNISAHGIAVLTSKSRPLRQYVELELTVPPHQVNISVTAVVARHAEDIKTTDAAESGLGLDFFLFDARAKATWQSFLGDLHQGKISAPSSLPPQPVAARMPRPSEVQIKPVAAPAPQLIVQSQTQPQAQSQEQVPVPLTQPRQAPPEPMVSLRDLELEAQAAPAMSPPAPSPSSNPNVVQAQDSLHSRAQRRPPPDEADETPTFIIKPRDLGRLWAFFRGEMTKGRVRIETPVLKAPGTSVELLVVHPNSQAEWTLQGRVSKADAEARGGRPVLEIALNELAMELKSEFRNFVTTGRGMIEEEVSLTMEVPSYLPSHSSLPPMAPPPVASTVPSEPSSGVQRLESVIIDLDNLGEDDLRNISGLIDAPKFPRPPSNSGYFEEDEPTQPPDFVTNDLELIEELQPLQPPPREPTPPTGEPTEVRTVGVAENVDPGKVTALLGAKNPFAAFFEEAAQAHTEPPPPPQTSKERDPFTSMAPTPAESAPVDREVGEMTTRSRPPLEALIQSSLGDQLSGPPKPISSLGPALNKPKPPPLPPPDIVTADLIQEDPPPRPPLKRAHSAVPNNGTSPAERRRARAMPPNLPTKPKRPPPLPSAVLEPVLNSSPPQQVPPQPKVPPLPPRRPPAPSAPKAPAMEQVRVVQGVPEQAQPVRPAQPAQPVQPQPMDSPKRNELPSWVVQNPLQHLEVVQPDPAAPKLTEEPIPLQASQVKRLGPQVPLQPPKPPPKRPALEKSAPRRPFSGPPAVPKPVVREPVVKQPAPEGPPAVVSRGVVPPSSRKQPQLSENQRASHHAMSTAGKDPDLDRDIALARARVVRSPNSVTACYRLSMLLLRRGEFGGEDEAIQSLERVVLLEPNHPGAHHKLAEVLARKGEYTRASDHLSKARKMGYRTDPDLEAVVAQGVKDGPV